MRRILLVDAGGLDLAAAIPALRERYAASVVTLTVDVGQTGHVAAGRSRALAAGALRAHFVDAREELAGEFFLRLLQAGVLRPYDLALSGAVLRTVLAGRLLEVAAMEGTTYLAHGFEQGSQAADHLARIIQRRSPDSLVIAAGAQASAPAAAPTGAGRDVVDVGSGLWWRRVTIHKPRKASGAAEAAGVRVGFGTQSSRRLDVAAVLAVSVVEGVPTALNGIEMSLVELVDAVGTIARHHGFGWSTISEQASADGAQTEVVDAPAAAVLSLAYGALARAAYSRTLGRLWRQVGPAYVAALNAGDWISDTREALDAFLAQARRPITGTVRLRLRRGRCRVVQWTLATAPVPPAGSNRLPGPRPSSVAQAGDALTLASPDGTIPH